MVQLGCYQGKTHLPLPSGKYAVGACDLLTNASLMRCFYPCSSDPESTYAKSSLWMKWFPSLEYAEGYMRFKFSRSIPFSGRLLTWMTHDPYCPVAKDEPIVKGEEKLPVIIFSHGMGACRSTYSILLTEMASHGYFVAAVEHRDGSAAATMIVKDGKKEFMYERKLQPDEKEYPMRNGQVGVRVGECHDAFKLIKSLCDDGETSKVDWVDKPDDKFLASIRDRLEMNKVIVSGHSFGGVTATKAVLTSKAEERDISFDYGVAFDSWLYPIREEAESLASQWKTSHEETSLPNLLFVNCENFQSANNLKVMKKFEHPINETVQTNAFTMRNTMHYAPTDIPTIFLGSWARVIYKRLFRTAPTELVFPVEDALTLSGQMFTSYLKTVRDKSDVQSFGKCVDENDKFLIRGTAYKEEVVSTN